MLKKTVTCTDWNGIERTEDFWFDLSKAECTEWNLLTEGGLEAYLQKIVDTKNVPELIKEFKHLVLAASGVKSADCRQFMKDDLIRKDFEQTPAYDIIFMEFVTDDKAAAEFVNGILPEMPKDHQPPAQQ
jgi:hypothetical protein